MIQTLWEKSTCSPSDYKTNFHSKETSNRFGEFGQRHLSGLGLCAASVEYIRSLAPVLSGLWLPITPGQESDTFFWPSPALPNTSTYPHTAHRHINKKKELKSLKSKV